MNVDQKKWHDLVDLHGKDKAKEMLATALREAADQVLEKGYPDVFGCALKPPDDEKFGAPFIWTVSVTLSYPWPG